MRQLFISVILLTVLCAFSTASHAQTTEPGANSAPSAPIPADVPINTQTTASTSTINQFDERRYMDPTYSNLAHLYWSLGILDVNRDSFIDNFMAISECKIYQTYINNDLEWRDIRQTTREYLRKNFKTFPTSFKITIPLYLLRYNYEDQYFDVDQEASSISNARNIDTIYYTKEITCGRVGDLDGYPRNLILNLNRPFSLPRLPVERELARLFLDEMNNKRSVPTVDVARQKRITQKPRVAYLELYFRVHSYRDTVYMAGRDAKAVVFAQIDYIKIYADKEKNKLLYEKNMYEEEQSKLRRRLGGDAGSAGSLELPEGPLFSDEIKKKK